MVASSPRDFTAVGPTPTYGASLAVRFGQDAKLDLLVPIDVKERYWIPSKPNDDRLEVDSTYTNFRRFQVTVGEQVKSPTRPITRPDPRTAAGATRRTSRSCSTSRADRVNRRARASSGSRGG